MSEQASDLDLRAVLAKIDRDRAETLKLQEETRKYVAEADKLWADSRRQREETNRLIDTLPERYRLENAKLWAETRKWRFDPYLVIVGAIIAGIFLRLPEILAWLK